MRCIRWALLALSGWTGLASADDGAGLDPTMIPSLIYSAGRSDTTRSNNGSGVGSGYFLDVNYARTFVNMGVDYKNFTQEHAANAYVGIGFANLLELQVGDGTRGPVQRLRHDFNLTQIYDFMTGNHRSPYSLTLDNRLTFTFAIERYSTHSELDNASIGFGLLY